MKYGFEEQRVDFEIDDECCANIEESYITRMVRNANELNKVRLTYDGCVSCGDDPVDYVDVIINEKAVVWA